MGTGISGQVSDGGTMVMPNVERKLSIKFPSNYNLEPFQKFRADILLLKTACSILRQSSNPLCDSWKSQASSLWAKQHRA